MWLVFGAEFYKTCPGDCPEGQIWSRKDVPQLLYMYSLKEAETSSVWNEVFWVIWHFDTAYCLIFKLLTKMYMDSKPRVQLFACCLKHWKTWIVMYFWVRGLVRDIQGGGIFGATIFLYCWHFKSCFVSEFRERNLKALRFWCERILTKMQY